MKKIFILFTFSVGLLGFFPFATQAVDLADTVEFNGATSEVSNAGRAIATGDVNGDGYDDMVFGAHGNDNGAVYLFYGESSALSSQPLTHGMAFSGEAESDAAGFAVATGDVNGDGYDDILIGAINNDDGGAAAGAVYLIYGQASTLSSSSLTSAIQFTGEENDVAGGAIATGDVNGDGYDDIFIGANDYNDSSNIAGAVYLIYGQAASLSSASLSSTIKFSGETGLAGNALTSGDINNDGYAEIIIGAYSANSAYLIYGQASALSSASLSSAIKFTGKTGSQQTGYSVAAGDVNYDSYDDLVIGDPTYGATDTGAVYIVYGEATELTSQSLASVTEFTGETASDYAGYSVAAGDVNSDEYVDIIVGATNNDDSATDAGAAYLISGQADALSSASLSSATEFTGETASDYAGYSVAAGDVNSDEFDDILIGVYFNDDGGTNVGAYYLAYVYVDADGDGKYGSSLVTDANDCNDSDATNSGITYYVDSDDDGWGDPTTGVTACIDFLPDGYVFNGDDTDDTDHDNDGTPDDTDNDDDADGIEDSVDTYPNDHDNDGISDADDTDDDNDGTDDEEDDYPLDYDNDGTNDGADDDDDADGITDSEDTYLFDYDNDGTDDASDMDDDNDGTDDVDDESPRDADNDGLSAQDDSSDTDHDNDGTEDSEDSDDDNDGISDDEDEYDYDHDNDGSSDVADGDDDADGTTDTEDDYLWDHDNDGTEDSEDSDDDNDGIEDSEDEYPNDHDNDGSNDDTDTDDDADGINDTEDDSLWDHDNDGTEDSEDTDDDNDGISDDEDEYPLDHDNDGTDDAADTDDDNDGIPDAEDADQFTNSNDIEIGNDGIDNDGDGTIDEDNTIAENGAHPEYGDDDPSLSAGYVNNILKIKGAKQGKIRVFYADHSVYRYTVYAKYKKTKKTKVKSYSSTGYLAVLHPTGKKLALVNVYNGEVFHKQRLAKTKRGYKKNSLKELDVRKDGTTEMVVTSKRQANVRVSIIKVKLAKETFKKKSTRTTTNAAVNPNKTKVKRKKLLLRNTKNKTVVVYRVTKKYKLVSNI